MLILLYCNQSIKISVNDNAYVKNQDLYFSISRIEIIVWLEFGCKKSKIKTLVSLLYSKLKMLTSFILIELGRCSTPNILIEASLFSNSYPNWFVRAVIRIVWIPLSYELITKYDIMSREKENKRKNELINSPKCMWNRL